MPTKAGILITTNSMNIAEISKTDDSKVVVAKPKSNHSWKLSISLPFVLWVIFSLFVAVELFVVYKYLYQNLVIEEVNLPVVPVTRINFQNYDKVRARLQEVSLYRATSTIDFAGKDADSGRANPFAEP